jgi:CheY-like chemotaxis protein/HPt (histidine-containing phosphotransfer) domain-containing protein
MAAGRSSPEPTAATGKRRAIAATPPTRAAAIAQRRLILVAEDNEINQKVLRQQLAQLGFAADFTNNGRAALQRWSSGDYALLLTDLHMPEMDGYDLTLAVRAKERGRSRMPIIALTANALQGEAERCRAVGMDEYLCKPATLADLAAALERWLPTPATGLPMAASSGASAPAAVQVHVLEALVGSDRQVIDELLREFRTSAAQLGTALLDAGAAGRTGEATQIAHKLKSSARSVGALELGELCATIEAAGKADDEAALRKLLPAFNAALAAVDDHLRTLQQPAPHPEAV